MTVLVTGAAGFVGYHCCQALLARGERVVGIDNLNRYYNPALKLLRLEPLCQHRSFKFKRIDLLRSTSLAEAWRATKPKKVLHLAAQAGVRHSLDEPMAYIRANVVAFQNVIELVRETSPENFVYASSSSVYGGCPTLPFTESLDVTSPVSLYAATKLENELVAKAYGSLFGLPSTGLRFFTVYGPMGRPDMAMWKFARAILQDQRIEVYGGGQMTRDFTYIDDIVDGVLRALDRPQIGAIYNLGSGELSSLPQMIEYLEKALGIRARKTYLPHQLGDAQATLADISRASKDLGYLPTMPLSLGVGRFVEWFLKVGHRY